MKKNNFIKYFNLTQNLLVLSLLELLVSFILTLVSSPFKHQSGTAFPFVEQAGRLITLSADVINFIGVLTFLIAVTLLYVEMIQRIRKDDFINLLTSIKRTYILRHFLHQKNTSEKPLDAKIIQKNPTYHIFNRAVHKAVIDTRLSKITIYIKIPNDQQATKLLNGMEKEIKEKLVDLNPEYYFSAPEHHQGAIWFKGTHKRMMEAPVAHNVKATGARPFDKV